MGGEIPSQTLSSLWLDNSSFFPNPLTIHVHSAIPSTQLHSRPHLHMSHHTNSRIGSPFNHICLSHLESLQDIKSLYLYRAPETLFGETRQEARFLYQHLEQCHHQMKGKVHFLLLEFSMKRDLLWRNISDMSMLPLFFSWGGTVI